ncbi:MAG: hypothetical protein M5T52_23690 [Ignavibacteriaceae bacterium]|nr:hypothetical protein [Ignavibacteriaceae bacterium]
MLDGGFTNLCTGTITRGRSIEIQLSFAMAYYNRGITKFELGDKNGARLDWNKAFDLGMKEAYNLIKRHCK